MESTSPQPARSLQVRPHRGLALLSTPRLSTLGERYGRLAFTQHGTAPPALRQYALWVLREVCEELERRMRPEVVR